MSKLDTCTKCGHQYDAICHQAKGKPPATCYSCYIEMLDDVLGSMQVASHVAFQATYGTPNHSVSQAKYRRMIRRLSDRIATLKKGK
jgi:protein-arginine kinase activator protein McsA